MGSYLVGCRHSLISFYLFFLVCSWLPMFGPHKSNYEQISHCAYGAATIDIFRSNECIHFPNCHAIKRECNEHVYV